MKNLSSSLQRSSLQQLLRSLVPSRADSETMSYVMLGIIMAAGLVLRLWQINALGFNSDEAVYAGQAAAIAGTPVLKDMFPIFRAHPLVFPFILSLGFRLAFSDLLGRLLVVAFGIGTIYLTYHIGALLYNLRVGLLAALLLAVMPYHVIVTRQVLLDGPMVFFVTLTLYTLARYALSQHAPWLWATGVAMGLTFLTKETGIVLMGGIYIFLALSPAIRVKVRDLIISIVCMVLVIVPHPIALALAGTTKTAGQYLLWQLFRRPNHTWDFYPTTVPYAIGPLVIAAAILGLWLMRRQRSWRELLLGGWILTPILFFQFWPVKGFQYLLPTAPAFAILCARVVIGWLPYRMTSSMRRVGTWVRPVAALVIVASLIVPSWQAVQTVNAETFLAGSGGVPGGREAGLWIRENVPLNATFLAIGPSMANIIQFYGYRKAYGLSVSTNPLRRNPVYVPVDNPDKTLRNGEIQYVVYDVFSANRSKTFADALMTYVKRFNGRVVHTESVAVPNGDGTTTLKPVIVIYEVRP